MTNKLTFSYSPILTCLSATSLLQNNRGLRDKLHGRKKFGNSLSSKGISLYPTDIFFLVRITP